MAPWVKCLPAKCGGVWKWRWETPEAHGPASLDYAGANDKTLPQTRWKVRIPDIPGCPQTSTHEPQHACACIHTYEHANTQTHRTHKDWGRGGRHNLNTSDGRIHKIIKEHLPLRANSGQKLKIKLKLCLVGTESPKWAAKKANFPKVGWTPRDWRESSAVTYLLPLQKSQVLPGPTYACNSSSGDLMPFSGLCTHKEGRHTHAQMHTTHAHTYTHAQDGGISF